MAKAKVEVPPIADLKSLEELEVMLETFVTSVNNQLAAENPEGQIEAKNAAIEMAKTSLLKDSAERRDQIIAVITKWEAREAELRSSVRVIETQARHWGSKAKSAKSTIELAMIEMGLTEVNGILHRFKIYKSPDLLTILNQEVIPPEYFDESPNVEKIIEAVQEIYEHHPQPDEMTPCACGAMEWPECRDLDLKLTLLTLIEVRKDLNKERLLTALAQPDTDIPGAILETNRKRLDIK
jgi:hypothetical protein